jgi:hypothetical protein
MKALARRVLLVLLVSAAGAGGAGCQARPGQLGQVAPSPSAWQPVEVAPHGFAIRMPAQPELKRESELAEDGGAMDVLSGTSVSADLALGFRILHDRAGFTGHPMAGGALVDLISERPAEGAQASETQVVYEHESLYQGLRCRDVVRVDPRAGATMHMRLLVGRYHVYGAFAIHASTDLQRLTPVVGAYFQSIQVDPAEAQSPVGSGALDVGRWSYIYPPEAEFAAALPGSAQHREATVVFDGESYPVNIYAVSSGRESYAIHEVRVGERPSMALLQHLRSSLASAPGQVREERDVESQGYSGLSYIVETGTSVVYSRFFLTAGRLYEVRATVPRGGEAESRPSVDNFFRYFKIL